MIAYWDAWNSVREHFISQKYQKSSVFIVATLGVLLGMNALYLVTTVMVAMAPIKIVTVNGYVAHFSSATTNKTQVLTLIQGYLIGFMTCIVDGKQSGINIWLKPSSYVNCSFHQEVIQIDVALILCRILTITVFIQLPSEFGKKSPLQ